MNSQNKKTEQKINSHRDLQTHIFASNWLHFCVKLASFMRQNCVILQVLVHYFVHLNFTTLVIILCHGIAFYSTLDIYFVLGCLLPIHINIILKARAPGQQSGISLNSDHWYAAPWAVSSRLARPQEKLSTKTKRRIIVLLKTYFCELI